MAEDMILRRQPEEEPEHYPQFYFFCPSGRVEEARALLSHIPGIRLKEQPKERILQTRISGGGEEETLTGSVVRGYCSEDTFDAVLSALSSSKIAGYSRASQVFFQKEKPKKSSMYAVPDKPVANPFDSDPGVN